MTPHSESHSVSDGRRWHGGSNNSARFSISRLNVIAKRGGSRTHLKALLTLLLLSSLLTAAPSEQAYGDHLGLIQQPNQQPSSAIRGTDDEKYPRTLKTDELVKREITGGQQHTYRLKLDASHFLKAIVEQDGIDVVVQVSGPDGKQILEFDSESRLRGREPVSLAAEAPGDYRLTVKPKLNGALAGSYQIRITELRAATDDDRSLHEARKLLDESLKLRRAGKYDEALPLAGRARGIRERLLGPEHPDVAAAINVQATLYYYKGEYTEAEPLYQRALSILEKSLGPEHLDVANTLNDIALLSQDSGDLAKAEAFYQRALTILEGALGRQHTRVADTLGNLANLYRKRDEYAKAESLLQRALGIKEESLGAEHLGVASILSNLALLYRDRGEYAKAEPLYQRALAIRERALGPEHSDLAGTINGLAILYEYVGDYAKAELFYRRALAIRERALGPEHPHVAISLNDLGILYWRKGDLAKAELLYQRALVIGEKALGAQHTEIANFLNNLAIIYSERREPEKAEPLYERALAIREKALGPNHNRVADSINNLAVLLQARGDYAKAESFYQRALTIWEKMLGPEHPRVAYSLHNLARLYQEKGDYTRAESLLQRALGIKGKVLGSEHPEIIGSLDMLAAIYAAKGDIPQAIAVQSRACAVAERNLSINLAIGSERQKLAYLTARSYQTDKVISLHLHYAPDDPIARDLAATVVLQRKARALDATSYTLNALRSRFGPEDQALLDKLIDARAQLAKFVLNGPQKMTSERYRARVKDLEELAERSEADISRRNAEFRAQSLPVSLETVQAAIPADTVLIEFASYRPFNAKVEKDDKAYGQPHYVAYVLRHNREIQWKELGEAKPIDRAIAALREALRDPLRRDVRLLARAVDQKIFQSLRPLLGELTRLLISPDGPLNLIPFAALVDEKGRYLVERYSISYLTSGRDLLRLQVDRASKNLPLVVANPDFGEPREVEVAKSPNPNEASLNDQPKGKPIAVSARSAFSQFSFLPLPYTAQEGEALRALLPGATLLTKRRATKAALLQIRSPLLLHIATHGFFLDDLKLTPPGGRGYQSFDGDPERLLKQIERSGIRIESPLLRSGLALAGANKHKQEENGILTALEATGLNLWGTKLVVLSACDTGVGEVRNGDGVYGLRRALVLAGSETQVMSLWAVPDKATQHLMVDYYRRLKQGKGRGEALRQVQLEMLKDVKSRHPYYWASFIQSGEWANLDGKR
jgi:CHAT domain-containing protein/Tfp pilus assembly protein PilF